MTDPWQKSKKPSSGKQGKSSDSKQRSPTFYLDENFDCREVREALDKARIKYRLYSQDVPANSGSRDVDFLPKVGRNGWLLITADWHQRTRPREAEDLLRYGVKHFIFAGNLGAGRMADLLIQAKTDIYACAKDYSGHVSATVQKNGRVNVVRDKLGALHQRGETKFYFKGRTHSSRPH